MITQMQTWSRFSAPDNWLCLWATLCARNIQVTEYPSHVRWRPRVKRPAEWLGLRKNHKQKRKLGTVWRLSQRQRRGSTAARIPLKLESGLHLLGVKTGLRDGLADAMIWRSRNYLQTAAMAAHFTNLNGIVPKVLLWRPLYQNKEKMPKQAEVRPNIFLQHRFEYSGKLRLVRIMRRTIIQHSLRTPDVSNVFTSLRQEHKLKRCVLAPHFK